MDPARKRILIGVIAGVAVVACLVFVASSRRQPLSLTLLSTKISDDEVHLVAALCLSNCSSRSWTYRDSSIPDELWRIQVKEGNLWKEGTMGGFVGSSWSQLARIGPGQSRILHVALPADGVKRMVGTFLERDGVRSESKPARFVRDLFYRAFGRTLILPGQYCAWCTNTLSSRLMIDRGLIATNWSRRLMFDSALWKNAKAEDRIAMARDLETNSLFLGKTKSEILELLGPELTFQDEAGYLFLGFQRLSTLSFPERQVLRVRLNELGRVTTIEIAPAY